MLPAISTCAITQPPKIVPCALVSAGIGTMRSTGCSPCGRKVGMGEMFDSNERLKSTPVCAPALRCRIRPMDERALREWIAEVRRGRMARRDFMRTMVALGLTAPLAATMLSVSGIARAATLPPYKPTRRGGGGVLRLLWWQGPTLLNPHF